MSGHTVDEATATSSPPSGRPESEPVAKRLALFLRDAAREGWDGCGLDGCDIQDNAVKYGLFKMEPYDPDKHGESNCCDPGEDWYVLADDVQALLSDGALGRQDDASQPSGMNNNHVRQALAKTQVAEGGEGG